MCSRDRQRPILIPISDASSQTFDLTMCNPPFYSSAEDVRKQKSSDRILLEMITEGGESAFVRRIVEESIVFDTGCKWYSSMLGKLSSVGEVVDVLKINSIDNYAITEFVQGQTRRWAVGWSFTDIRLPDMST